MAYQPNPFVDPNKRGVELPAGCKDLNDVLAKAGMGEGQFAMPSRVQRSTVGRVRDFVSQLYETKRVGQMLVVVAPGRDVLLILSRAEEGFELTLLLHRRDAFVEEAVGGIFGESVVAQIREQKDELRTVRLGLPDWWDDAAQIVVDLLIRGYGMTDSAQVFVIWQQKGEGAIPKS